MSQHNAVREPVQSSAIVSVAYSSSNAVLDVEFRSGAIYRYFAVPPKVFQDFLASDSKGTYLNARIKGSFGYERLLMSYEGD